MNKIARNKGFTLIEILVVIGIIAVLAAIVIIAINPARQFAQARNAQRVSNVNTILNAIGQNMADNKGIWTCKDGAGNFVYFNGSSASTSIGTTAGATFSDLSCLAPTYIASGIPQDPNGGTLADTKYTISTTTTGSVMICAPLSAEPAISTPPPAPICVIR